MNNYSMKLFRGKTSHRLFFHGSSRIDHVLSIGTSFRSIEGYSIVCFLGNRASYVGTNQSLIRLSDDIGITGKVWHPPAVQIAPEDHKLVVDVEVRCRSIIQALRLGYRSREP